MSELNHLANTIEQHFANSPASSFVHFVVVSDGLTGEQAAQVPGEQFNSIWAITNHMAFLMDYTRAALLDEDVDLIVWGMAEIGKGWPPLGAITDAAWQAARQCAMERCRAFAAVIRTLDSATLDEPQRRLSGGTPRQAIMAMYGHNCYHTAELLTVRHMQGLWVDHQWA
ncbi:MAG: DinB family protein [Anaerolineae bacterium]|nr:DinB family protein [Anaerolineae bacterium]